MCYNSIKIGCVPAEQSDSIGVETHDAIMYKISIRRHAFRKHSFEHPKKCLRRQLCAWCDVPYGRWEETSLKVAVIDDMPEAVASVQNMLEQYAPGTESVGFTDANEYHKYLETTGEQFDVMFLDIMLKDQLGISIAYDFVRENPGLMLVFMSADSVWFREVYRVPHCYFLTKPLEGLYFKDCIRRIGEELSNRKFVLHIGGEERVISLKDVTYIESALRKAVFHFLDGSQISVSQKIDRIDESISQISFVRIHKSFIVNLANVEKVDRNKVIFPDGTYVNVSRSYLTSFREKSATYFGGMI